MEIHQRKARHAEYSTMCPFTVQDVDIPHWKFVIFCLLTFPSVKILYEEKQDNINTPNIQY